MKTVFLFTNQFPYGTAEPYIESEMKYWSQYEKVYIFSLQLRKKNIQTLRKTPDNTKVFPIEFQPIGYLLCFFYVLIDINFYKEIKELVNSKRLSLYAIFQLFVSISRSHFEANQVYKGIKKQKFKPEDTVFYSYRFGYQPYVAVLLRKKMNLDSKIIARAHGYDLYEKLKKSGYIPLRRIILDSMTYCFPCSGYGTEYLKKCYPEFKSKIMTKYLGTEDHNTIILKRERRFKIVSCSNIVKVKRIDLLIRALSHIKNYEIEWTHYGDGVLKNDLQNLSNQVLEKNISVVWKGNIPNEILLKEYEINKYNLFINVSFSEGLPVSIMEAMSFGIPCVATDVGGTSEIVNNENGVLLPADPAEESIAETIVNFIVMEEMDYQKKCQQARITWKKSFSSDINYRSFSSLVNEM